MNPLNSGILELPFCFPQCHLLYMQWPAETYAVNSSTCQLIFIDIILSCAVKNLLNTLNEILTSCKNQPCPPYRSEDIDNWNSKSCWKFSKMVRRTIQALIGGAFHVCYVNFREWSNAFSWFVVLNLVELSQALTEPYAGWFHSSWTVY